jgi:Tol biopolymer transport system component
MALKLDPGVVRGFISVGTLARAPLGGGAPREVLASVHWADWAPDGSLAVVREAEGRIRLEFPIGQVLYETAGWITHPRVSPRGDQVAFIDHPSRGDDGGEVAVVDREGKKRVLSSGWISAAGLAWSPGGEELWFTATRVGVGRVLHAATMRGRERVLSRSAGTLEVVDVAPNGRALIIQHNPRMSIACWPPGAKSERDLSWLDWSLVRDISADGRTILFDETGEGGGASYATYIRKTDGSPAVRLGEGSAVGLSPDGAWALTLVRRPASQLVLLPTGPGESRPLPTGGINLHSAAWFPDGKRVLIQGNETGRALRLYLQDIEGVAPPEAVTEEGTSLGFMGDPVSPDGRTFLAYSPEGQILLHPVDGGEPRPVPGIAADDTPVAWGASPTTVYVRPSSSMPARIFRLDLSTGRRELWRELRPADPAGALAVTSVALTPDASSYAYSYVRFPADLYLVEGIK